MEGERNMLLDLNTDVIQSLVDSERERSFMDVIRLIHRTLRAKMNPVFLRDNPSIHGKGHFLPSNIPVGEEYEDFVVTSPDGSGKLIYRNIVYPGHHAPVIFKSLDIRLKNLENDMESIQDLFRLMALITVITGTAHGFPDANGRVAVGAADWFTRYFDGGFLDYGKVYAQNEKLIGTMALGSAFLFPEIYNPLQYIPPGIRNIEIPHSEDFKVKYTQSIISYLLRFALNPEKEERMDSDVLSSIAQIYFSAYTKNE